MAIKLLFMDMEGTLVSNKKNEFLDENANSLWTRLVHTLGPEAVAEDDEGFRKWNAGEFEGFMEWCDYCLRIFQKYGLTRAQFEEAINSMTMNDGVADTIANLHKRGIRTAIISGGFMAQAARLQQALKVNHAYASTEIYWTSEGKMEHWNLLPSDLQGKVDFVELLRREYHLSKEECAFIGDGKNDVAIAKHVGTSFAYQAHNTLKAVATHSIEDFRDILKHI